ncbi:polysaccharide biosynthesis/export family protein [Novosphingobium sp. BW1]|uniref:polysaccharide biosynthesis/export family protein n=1 Tax=Novosphingobium sp. BW1 TaxID=2592621 RepID=UPI001F0733A2|nr:polysaccharide biosynthesis/export family protein [Novosphingobium sp. BW1]
MQFRLGMALSFLALAGCGVQVSRELPSVGVVEYRLSPGDQLHLEVFREESLSGDYVVNDAGAITLPMAGDFLVTGKTLAQARAELEALLAGGYVREARVNLTMAEYRPVFILGEVTRPGEYGYAQRMSVHALVAKAGGFTYRANEKVVYIRHALEGEETAYALTSAAAVMPGDTVRIGARYF